MTRRNFLFQAQLQKLLQEIEEADQVWIKEPWNFKK
jgi:hypothetical protein